MEKNVKKKIVFTTMNNMIVNIKIAKDKTVFTFTKKNKQILKIITK